MTFLDSEIYEAAENYLPTVSEYVSSHGGGIDLLGAKDGTVYITLTGACGGCSMSLMTTKMVVQKKLRELIHPELVIVNVDGTPENVMPGDVYVAPVKEEITKSLAPRSGMLENLKHMIGL